MNCTPKWKCSSVSRIRVVSFRLHQHDGNGCWSRKEWMRSAGRGQDAEVSAQRQGEGALGQPGAINHCVCKELCFSPEERSPSVATSETLQGGGGLRIPVPPSHHCISSNPCTQLGEGELQNKPQMFHITPANAWKEITHPSPCDGRGDAECEWLKVQGAYVGIWRDEFDYRLSGVTEKSFVEEGLSRGSSGVSIPLLLLSTSHEDAGADFPAWRISFLGLCCLQHACPWSQGRGCSALPPSSCLAHIQGITQHIHPLYSSISVKLLSLSFFFKREDFISDVCRAKTLALCFTPCDGFLSCGGTKSPMWCRTAAPGSLQGLQKDTEKSPITS